MEAVTFRASVARSADALEQMAAELRSAVRPVELAPGNIVRVRELADTAKETVTGLLGEAKKLAPRSKDPALSVELGVGIVRVLRLSDASVRRSYGKNGVTVTKHGQHKVVVTGHRDALESLKKHAKSKTTLADTPLWHTASASSAVRQLESMGL